MSKLFEAMNATATTENGAKAFNSTLNTNLDFFYKAGASRGTDLTPAFIAAFVEDFDIAIKTLLWTRDARHGAGEREQFKNLCLTLLREDAALAERVMLRIPELGRFDDLKIFWNTSLEGKAASLWLKAMNEGNGLAFKWAPRKDKKGAKPLRKSMSLSEAQWRKYVVAGSDTVEQKMCAKEWESINFNHVPSVAMSRYQTAFHNNCGKTFEKYKDALVKGEAKVNAGAVYPYDIIKPFKSGLYGRPYGRDADPTVLDAQWQALPNYIGDSEDNFLPIIDTSGSMYSIISGSTSVLDVAVSLGLYTSERCNGIFKDTFMTFSDHPKMIKLKGSLSQRLQQMTSKDWGYGTDIQAVFVTLLHQAIDWKVPASEMPTKLLLVSDMQFNDSFRDGDESVHVMDMIREEYGAAGYEVPQIVYWQVNARKGGIPITAHESGAALVSGFSPSLLPAVLGGSLSPEKAMLDIVDVERYSY